MINRVEVDWTNLNDDRDPLWYVNYCLYSYVHPETERILYIGKADFQTVRQRTYGAHKADLFDYLCARYDIADIGVLQGELLLDPGRRLSSQLLSAVESLLIWKLQPPGNVSCTSSRLCRPGLRVQCTGDWPHRRTGFYDL